MSGQASHLVLARKWRPQRLEDLVGQEHITKVLRQALLKKRIAHAFLFCGIHGVGKTSAARILARCLNCEQGPTPDPCGRCQPCIEISEGRSLDVIEIDGATYRKIDDARSIIENLAYRPARDRFKVYIIDEAHQLTEQAFNALLKTLEEPPPHVKFILATTEPQKMPETILSRLQRYDFRRIPLPAIIARLKELAKRENVEVETGAIVLIAREAGGSMRDAERMLETALAMADGVVRESDVAQMLGVARRSQVLEVAKAIIQKDAAKSLKLVREFYEAGVVPESIGRDLLEVLRNLAFSKLENKNTTSLLSELSDFEASELRSLSELVSLRDICRLFRLMAQAQEEILRSAWSELVLEMAVIRMATMAPVVEADELIRTIKAIQTAPPETSGSQSSPTENTGQEQTKLSRTTKRSQRSKLKSSELDPEPNPTLVAEKLISQDSAEAQLDSTEGGDSSFSKKALTVNETINQSLSHDQPKASDSRTGAFPSGGSSTSEQSELRTLREFIRRREVPLAGFMEQGASLKLENNVLVVVAKTDFYARYFRDKVQIISKLASEHLGFPVTVKITSSDDLSGESSAERAESPLQSSLESLKNDKSQGPAPSAEENVLPEHSAAEQHPRSSRTQTLKRDPLVREIFDRLDARLIGVHAVSSSASREADVGKESSDPN